MSSGSESKNNPNKRARELCESSEQHGNTEFEGVSLIERLPNEIFFHIFSCLMPHTLKVTTFVSKFWHQISESEDVWKEICNVRGWDDSTEFLAEYEHGIPRTKSYKQIYYQWKDDRENCCVCGDETKRYHYILDMALCKKCYKSDPDYKLISKTECKSVYLLDDYDLTFLRSSMEPPKPFTHVFLKSDVEEFVTKKQKQNEEKQETKRLKTTNEKETQIKAKEDNSKNETNNHINNNNNNNNNEPACTDSRKRSVETLRISLWNLYHKGNMWAHLQSNYRKILDLEAVPDDFFDYSKFFSPELQGVDGKKCKVYHPACDPFENAWLSPLNPYDRIDLIETKNVDWFTLQSDLSKYWENDNACEVAIWLANVNILIDMHTYLKNHLEDFEKGKSLLFESIKAVSNMLYTTELPPISTYRTFEKFLPVLTKEQISARSFFRDMIEVVIKICEQDLWTHLFNIANEERIRRKKNSEILLAFFNFYRRFKIPLEIKDEFELQIRRREERLENGDDEENNEEEGEWDFYEIFV